jgi:Pyruvate/2-oxoacid:ferredoxin oxidoreductase delta subunit
VFGSFARDFEENGSGRAVSKEEMRDIVTERWEKKLIFLTANVSPSSPNAICTCCDCCCHFVEVINNFGGKVLMAAPHFFAVVDESLCDDCGKCSMCCNTHAHTYKNKTHQFDRDKCIGCGICVATCKRSAITMVENPAYKPPSEDLKKLGLKLFPTTALAGLKAKLTR